MKNVVIFPLLFSELDMSMKPKIEKKVVEVYLKSFLCKDFKLKNFFFSTLHHKLQFIFFQSLTFAD